MPGIKEMKHIFGFLWSWFSIIFLAVYYFIAMTIVETTLLWRYFALIIVIAGFLSFLVVVLLKRWASRQ
jgi:hypothetical protein